MCAAPPNSSMPSRCRWTGPTVRLTRPFAVWMPSTRSAREFVPRRTRVFPRASASPCSAGISGNCPRSSIWRGNWAPSGFHFWRSTSPIRTPSAAPTTLFRILRCGRRTCRVFDAVLTAMQRDYLEDFRSGFIAESPQKLRRIRQYFAAIQGQAPYPPVRCNAPEFSAVIGATGRVQPCFFIQGSSAARLSGEAAATEQNLEQILNRADMADLRTAIRTGARAECKTCVCTLWRPA